VSRWPNFFVIGAGKSGTTSLYHYLKQHPQIFMSPVKEPKYFALAGHDLDFKGPGDSRIVPDTTTTESAYLALFEGAGDEPVVGEASTIYLGDFGAAAKMAGQVPDARLVAVLRHPADRAYSAYLHLRRDGYETLDSFADALASEAERARLGYYYHWYLRARGFYGRQLQEFYDSFPREQIRIYLFEDFESSPQRVLSDIFRFLGIDETFKADTSARHNQSGIPRHLKTQTFLNKAHPLKQWLKRFIPEHWGHRVISMIQPGLVEKPAMPPDVRAELTEDFRDDILHLQDLIERDLSHWLVRREQAG